MSRYYYYYLLTKGAQELCYFSGALTLSLVKRGLTILNKISKQHMYIQINIKDG